MKRFLFGYKNLLLSCCLIIVDSSIGNITAEAQCVVHQTHKLLAEDGEAGDYFGSSLGSAFISGKTAIFGVKNDDDNGPGSGAAYLFDTTTGQQLFKLLADDGEAGDDFGFSVGIDGTTAIVGAIWDDDSFDNGSAYLFDTTTGQQLFKLLPDDAHEARFFGVSVGISGTTAIVGASAGNYPAYLFDTTTGQQIAKLQGDDNPGPGIVAISGNTAIVGDYEDSVNGFESGAAYVFDTTTGQQIAILRPDDGTADDRFGGKVAISGTTAIIGASHRFDEGEHIGSAYLFDTTTGQQLFKLLPDDGAVGDGFYRVGISGTIAIVGARGNDDNGENSGSAYLFDTTTGKQIAKLLPDDGAEHDLFGYASISGTIAVVGADGDDDNGENSGSAYVFDVSSCVEVDVVNADNFNIFRGFHIGGDLSATFDSDDSYLKFNPGLTINSAEPSVWIEFNGTLPSDSPSLLSVTVEAQASTVGLTQTIEMFNWNTNQYQQVDSAAASWNNDTVVTVDVTAGIVDYVDAGTGAVKTRMGWKQTGLILNYPWTICIDQIVWTVTQ